MVHLLRVEEEYRLELREIRFDSSMLKQIIQNGVPVSYTHLVCCTGWNRLDTSGSSSSFKDVRYVEF